MAARIKNFASIVKAAEKGETDKRDKAYEFTQKTFYEKPKPPGKHIRD